MYTYIGYVYTKPNFSGLVGNPETFFQFKVAVYSEVMNSV